MNAGHNYLLAELEREQAEQARWSQVFPMATGCSFKAPPKPIEPEPDRTDQRIHLFRWLLLTAAVMAGAAAAGFFNK